MDLDLVCGPTRQKPNLGLSFVGAVSWAQNSDLTYEPGRKPKPSGLNWVDGPSFPYLKIEAWPYSNKKNL